MLFDGPVKMLANFGDEQLLSDERLAEKVTRFKGCTDGCTYDDPTKKKRYCLER